MLTHARHTHTLDACSKPDATTEAWALLRRMKDDLRLVSGELMSAIRAWFVGMGPAWSAETTSVDDEGVCARDARVRLQAVRRVRALDDTVRTRASIDVLTEMRCVGPRRPRSRRLI
jgi:hypothetical protein